MPQRTNFLTARATTKNLEDFCARVSQTELMLSSRMHPTVIASSCRVPTVVITYDYKQLGLMEQLGLDSYVIDINQVTYENLISTMEKAWKNRRFIREHLEMQIPNVAKQNQTHD